MHPGPGPRVVWLSLLVAGLLAFALSLRLPWRDPDLPLGPATLAVIALSGSVLLTAAARAASRSAWPTGLLGATVLAYPSLRALGASGTAETLAAAWHTLPLTLAQLAPLLASRRAVDRCHRRWEGLVLGVAVAGAVVSGLALALAGPALTTVGVVLWFASFAIAPVGTWVAVRGTGGEVRRRALVAALASLVPVVVITGCVLLGMLAGTLGARAGVTVTALMVGFSVGTLLCGVLCLGAGAAYGSVVLRTSTLVALLHAVLASLGLVVGGVVALVVSAAAASPAAAVLVGAAVAVATGLPWLWLHGWLRRVVDPGSEVRHELAALGRVGPGGQGQALEHVLRRVTGDAALSVHAELREDHATAGGDVVLAREAGAVLLARSEDPAVAARLRELGDLTDVVRPALLEARVEHETGRADAAAAAERERLSQDLHDGLQGRLLGLALRLQLGVRDVEDPGARLLTGEAVEALRSMVDDVRALAGGGPPERLTREGLAPALVDLVAPVGSLVSLDLPEARFGAQAEAAAYFVVAEAVTNALKHAGASRIDVRVAVLDDHRVGVTVTDDGRGGADPRLGAGLRGLAERVAAGGGAFVVRDDRPGTVVEAVLPCGS